MVTDSIPMPPREPLIVGGEELPEELHAAWHRLQRAWLEGAIAIAQQRAQEAAAAEAEQPAEVAS